MRLRNRLERLEDLMRDPYDNGEKKSKELIKSWMDNDPQAAPLFKAYEDYCRKSGVPYHPKERWIELTRTDPIALKMAREYLESYRNYVKTHFGVIIDEVDSATFN